MRLYSGTSQQFITDTTLNQIAERLKSAFFEYYRYNPSLSEVNSWRNSLRALKDVMELAKLNDHGVILEYQLPLSSKRIDCILTGQNRDARDNAVLIELKQWEKAEESDGDHTVRTFVGGGLRDVLHPCAQVKQYSLYLADSHTAFYEGNNPVSLSACSYLHNYIYDSKDYLFNSKFDSLLDSYPLFAGSNIKDFVKYIQTKLDAGNGLDVLARVEESTYRPSKKLMSHVAEVINGEPRYVLLDEQLVVFDKVLAAVRNSYDDIKQQVIIVIGGPGTGKSVVAINLMSELLKLGLNAHYSTGSRAFTQTLRKVIGPRGAVQFKYFKDYVSAEVNEVDVIIADEAHRLREKTFNRFQPHLKSDKLQVEEMLRASRVTVFFIDDHQVVRPDEVGSVEHIRNAAEKQGCTVTEFKLETQFRCAGSDGFVNWINNTLQVKTTANVLWTGKESFDFRIFPDPVSLDNAIREKNHEGSSARLVAGYCWPWSKITDEEGNLIEDIQLDNFSRPWNARPGLTGLKKGIPPAELWAYEENGVNQVGCVYTAQGFEFDYVGVIVGTDLTYNLDSQTWVGNKSHSKDHVVKRSKEAFLDLVKNTYRVLFSRGMKGCYVYFVDKDTERFFKTRMVKGNND